MKKEFLEFNDAREFVKSLNLRGVRDWISYCESGRKPDNIPRASNIIYKDQWIGMCDWLGCKDGRTGRLRKYDVNDNYFSNWSADMAYILGFWWADGSIAINNGSNRFSLCQKEKEILVDIARRLGCPESTIRLYNKAHLFAISSSTIVKDIMRFGGTPNKSLISIIPEVPAEFFFDFVRGYFDGDGSIYYNRRAGFYQSKITCGSEQFIVKLHQKLKHRLPSLRGHLEVRLPRTDKGWAKHKTYNLHFSANDTVLLAKSLYCSASTLRLQRKFDLFQKSILENPTKILYSYQEVKHLIQVKGIKSIKELMEYRIRQKDFRIPAHMSMYKPEYKGVDDLDEYFHKKRFFASFEESKKLVSGLKLKRIVDFKEWIKTDSRPLFIHSNPQKYYKNNGWTNWFDYLGKPRN